MNRILNLFLHKHGHNLTTCTYVGYNFTDKLVHSWKESGLYGGDFMPHCTYLGENRTPKEIVNSIKELIEEQEVLHLITEIHLHNDGDYYGGDIDGLPTQELFNIHSSLAKDRKSFKPKIYFIPDKRGR